MEIFSIGRRVFLICLLNSLSLFMTGLVLDTKFITNFAGTIGTPAMIFYTITTTGVTLEIFTEYFIYAVIILGAFALVGFFSIVCSFLIVDFFNDSNYFGIILIIV